jgi:phage terminase Nu1 subunit (DNA packaging protein)
MAKKKTAPGRKQRPAIVLKGWTTIAKFLGTGPASAQTWAKQGMPVKREGRFTVADRAEVQAWLGQQSHMPKPAHILTGDADIAAALKESISVVKRKE